MSDISEEASSFFLLFGIYLSLSFILHQLPNEFSRHFAVLTLD